jgi:hypothetical protein
MEQMALKIIAVEKIDKKECYFIYVRSYHNKKNQMNEIKFDSYSILQRSNHLYYKLYFYLRKVCRTVEKQINFSNYKLYTYHTSSVLAQTLISNSKCKGYYIVEEGLASYIPDYTKKISISAWERLLLIFSSLGHIGLIGKVLYNTTHQKFMGAFAMTNDAFPLIENKKIIGFPFKEIKIKNDIQALFVFDGGILNKSDIIETLDLFAKRFWQIKYPTVYFKFHPRQNENQRQLYMGVFDSLSSQYSLSFKELSTEVSLENILFSLRENLSVYFVHSSVGFYAALLGCNCFSVAKMYADKEPVLKKLLKVLPSNMLRKINFV